MEEQPSGFGPRLKFINVIILGVSFMLIFTGFQTCGMVEQTVLNSYQNDTARNGTITFHASGYTSLAILYIVFAFANWLAPSVVSILGPKYSMVVGGATYALYLSTFIKPLASTLYAASTLIGIGAAILWTAEGNFLTLNSNEETIGRNSGIFWALMQCSFLVGNLYVFFAWRGVENIEDKQRIPLFIGLTAVCVLGTLVLLVLRNVPKATSEEARHDNDGDEGALINEAEQESDQTLQVATTSKAGGAWRAFKISLQLFCSIDMMLLSVTFFYTGLELTFYSSVYTTIVGATKKFGADSDSLVGLTGIFIGVGEIFGGGLFGIFGKKTVRYGRDPIIFLGGTVHLITFLLIFLNIPDVAPIKEATSDVAYITPNTYLAIACGFLLGFADACFNTQCYSIIGSKYSNNSAPAFALFYFEQSLAAAIGFFYSSHLVLKWQLLILVVFAVAGTISFFVVERKIRIKSSRGRYSSIDRSSQDGEQ